MIRLYTNGLFLLDILRNRTLLLLNFGNNTFGIFTTHGLINIYILYTDNRH